MKSTTFPYWYVPPTANLNTEGGDAEANIID